MYLYTYSRAPNKRIGKITVQRGKSVKFNNSIVPSNSMGGGQIVRCKAKASLENYTDQCFFSAEYS